MFKIRLFSLILFFQKQAALTKAEKTRQMIIETAAPLLNEKGIAGTSIDDILRVTKVAKGCLYSHFENKETLSYAMVDYLLQKVSLYIFEKLAKEKTGKMKLVAFMNIYKNPLNPPIDGGCPILNFATETDDTNPVIRQKVKVIIQKSIQLIADIVNKGIAEKEFSADFNAGEFALKMFALLEGGMMICRAANSNKQMNSIIDMLQQEIESYQVQ